MLANLREVFKGCKEPGGARVLRVDSDHSYKLDEAALERVLLREEVRDLPVVVVSIAGAFREGKSFLLDFCLRYLKSPEQSRKNGNWLGEENEPLVGFSWSGGSERDTTGIVMWPEPIVTTLPSGKKVAVILMDTQGAFDKNSTLRDSSTIFALSTLISSYQIFNVKGDIKEDSFQILQLFTKYAKLAQNGENGSAFQVLQILIRDWQYPTEYLYGAEGGAQFLQKKLRSESNQPEELREVHEHISSCFDSITCFLMPHPGFTVFEPSFKGCLCDIRNEFKLALLELVPSIFDSTKLLPKAIGGEWIKARDLFEHFKTYVATFNGKDFPTPVTILKAISEAGLATTGREAREAYEARMESVCGTAQPSVPEDALCDAHREALRGACDLFSTKKLMASKEDIKDHLARLMQELEGNLTRYSTMNEAKLQKTISKAYKTYDESVRRVNEIQRLCLHPLDLDEVHREAAAAAMKIFDAGRRSANVTEDVKRIAMLNELKERHKQLREHNEQNNMVALMQAREEYVTCMENVCDSYSCVSAAVLQLKHEQAQARALQTFHSRRNRATEHPHDIHLDNLREMIASLYSKTQILNKSNNISAVEAAVHVYKSCMLAAVGPPPRCLHPDDLLDDHRRALDKALDEFHSIRSFNDDNGDDEDRTMMLEKIERRFNELREQNEDNNTSAVEAAYDEYCRKMDKRCGPSICSLLVLPLLYKIFVDLPWYHNLAKEAALKVFQARRRNNRPHDQDCYLDSLNEMLKEGCNFYCNPIIAIVRELRAEVSPPAIKF